MTYTQKIVSTSVFAIAAFVAVTFAFADTTIIVTGNTSAGENQPTGFSTATQPLTLRTNSILTRPRSASAVCT